MLEASTTLRCKREDIVAQLLYAFCAEIYFATIFLWAMPCWRRCIMAQQKAWECGVKPPCSRKICQRMLIYRHRRRSRRGVNDSTQARWFDEPAEFIIIDLIFTHCVPLAGTAFIKMAVRMRLLLSITDDGSAHAYWANLLVSGAHGETKKIVRLEASSLHYEHE